MRILCAAWLFFAAISLQAQEPTTEVDRSDWTADQWVKAARADVRSSYHTFIENHPGVYDENNPDFLAQLAKARDEGLKYASAAEDFGGYSTALGAFSSVLQDGHALAVATGGSASGEAVQWPGFLASWRGNALYVHDASGDERLAPGMKVIACNGAPIRDFVTDHFRSERFRFSEAGQWWAAAPLIFLSEYGAPNSRPKNCTFGGQEGTELALELVWQPAPADIYLRRRMLNRGDRPQIQLSEPRPGLFHIGLPDFQPNEAGRTAYETLYAAVDEQRADLLGARALILDLRHNNGGSSTWSAQLARKLWGKDAVASLGGDKTEIHWRASEGSQRHVEQIVGRLEEQGLAEYVTYFEDIAAGMDAAIARGDVFFVEADGDPEPDAHTVPVPSDLTTPVYVITPGGCASACLDAIDIFKKFGNTILIGAPTSADSTYMEVRVEDLPSGPGKIVIPNKVYVGRGRASGEVYFPDVPMNDLEWATSVFLDRIEEDLKSRKVLIR